MKLFFPISLLLIAQLGAAEPFENLRPGHPRLILTKERIAEINQHIASDPLAEKWHKRLNTRAAGLLKKPPVVYDLANKKLLVESRDVLARVTTLAGLYAISGEKRYAESAIATMLNAASFPDWNPASFLSPAEMTTAIALGYDWLYDELTPEQRKILRRAIIEKGLKPGLRVYATGKSWPNARSNWNAVCNGGLVIGALAIADTDPEIAGKILSEVRRTLPKGMLDFAPDGGWPEGPGYWAYATKYNAFCFSALQSALGTDFGFTKSPGFSVTGNFRIQAIGNSGLNFNFADAPTRPSPASQMLWLARTFNHPEYDAFERNIAAERPDIFHLIWFNPQFSNAESTKALESIPRCVKFDGVRTAFLRSGAGATDTFVGIKGGDNGANHSNLDLGSFVIDQGGQRFAEELGADSYTLPGYFGKQRWDYYRTRTEGQNTLTIDGENQNTKGTAEIISFIDDTVKPFAVIDLTDGYPSAEKVLRGVSLDGQGNILFQDEITAKEPVSVTWHFHTESAIALHGKSATLTKGGRKMEATIVEPPDAVFATDIPDITPPQRPVAGIKKIFIKLPAKTLNTRIVVRFSPEAGAAAPPVVPLDAWEKP